MHTTVTKKTRFHHNGDYSGDVIVSRLDNQGGILTIPFEDLVQIVGEYIKDELIGKLEQRSGKQLIQKMTKFL